MVNDLEWPLLFSLIIIFTLDRDRNLHAWVYVCACALKGVS